MQIRGRQANVVGRTDHYDNYLLVGYLSEWEQAHAHAAQTALII